MKLHPEYHTYLMENLHGLNRDVVTARRLVRSTSLSYARIARQIGVSKNMVGMVLTGRKKSARVLAGIAEVCRARLEGRQ